MVCYHRSTVKTLTVKTTTFTSTNGKMERKTSGLKSVVWPLPFPTTETSRHLNRLQSSSSNNLPASYHQPRTKAPTISPISTRSSTGRKRRAPRRTQLPNPESNKGHSHRLATRRADQTWEDQRGHERGAEEVQAAGWREVHHPHHSISQETDGRSGRIISVNDNVRRLSCWRRGDNACEVALPFSLRLYRYCLS